jgi:hypothetical protein
VSRLNIYNKNKRLNNYARYGFTRFYFWFVNKPTVIALNSVQPELLDRVAETDIEAVFYFSERSVLTITQHGVPLFRVLLTSRERFLPFTGRYPYGE